MKWIACELHTHTIHSDGQFSVRELLCRARSLELEAIALTDHNTASGLADYERNRLSDILPLIRGIEWTTYYGHVLILGSESYVDWRDVLPDNIDEKLKMVHQAKGVVGVAHPYAAGDPVCSGCHWEFKLKDWSLADYIEIWSGTRPQLLEHNKKALDKWTALLDKGLFLTAVSARDWHGGENDAEPFAVTYLQLDESLDITVAAKDALAKHRAYVTVGPTIDLSVSTNHAEAGIGGVLPRGKAVFRVTIRGEKRKEIWSRFGIELRKLVLIGKGGKVKAHAGFVAYGREIIVPVENASDWIRVEVHGVMEGVECTIAVTNPVFFS